jgi:hypothetical protein
METKVILLIGLAITFVVCVIVILYFIFNKSTSEDAEAEGDVEAEAEEVVEAVQTSTRPEFILLDTYKQVFDSRPTETKKAKGNKWGRARIGGKSSGELHWSCGPGSYWAMEGNDSYCYDDPGKYPN